MKPRLRGKPSFDHTLSSRTKYPQEHPLLIARSVVRIPQMHAQYDPGHRVATTYALISHKSNHAISTRAILSGILRQRNGTNQKLTVFYAHALIHPGFHQRCTKSGRSSHRLSDNTPAECEARHCACEGFLFLSELHFDLWTLAPVENPVTQSKISAVYMELSFQTTNTTIKTLESSTDHVDRHITDNGHQTVAKHYPETQFRSIFSPSV